MSGGVRGRKFPNQRNFLLLDRGIKFGAKLEIFAKFVINFYYYETHYF